MQTGHAYEDNVEVYSHYLGKIGVIGGLYGVPISEYPTLYLVHLPHRIQVYLIHSWISGYL